MIVWNKEEHNDIPKSIEEMKEAKKNLDRVGKVIAKNAKAVDLVAKVLTTVI